MSEVRSPFPQAYFAQLAEVESSNWWFRSRNRTLIWVLEKKAGQFKNFLEVGCGTGYVLEGVRNAFPEVEMFGAEYHDEGLDFARARIPTASFRQLDVTKMTDTDCFDVIGAFDVIEHIEEDQKSLSNLARALKPNGKLILSVPQHQWLWSHTDEAACHVRRYSSKDLEKKLRQAGLKLEYKSSFVTLLVPLMYISRQRSSKLEADPMSELKTPKALNALLELVMKLELLLMKSGVRFPVGGSLLVVASKADN
ncbi:class I SAM-dependent methyltransferase [Pseudomonas hormoni]